MLPRLQFCGPLASVKASSERVIALRRFGDDFRARTDHPNPDRHARRSRWEDDRGAAARRRFAPGLIFTLTLEGAQVLLDRRGHRAEKRAGSFLGDGISAALRLCWPFGTFPWINVEPTPRMSSACNNFDGKK